MPKKAKFYKKPKFIVLLAILLVGTVGAYAYFSQEEEIDYDFIVAERGELIQEVSVTGRVEPVESVNLAFERSGRVAHVYVNVGDKITKGQKLVTLANADLAAQLRQAQAGVSSAKAQVQQYHAAVESQQAKLDELKRGTRPEEIQIAETTVYNAEKALEDAGKNLENIKNKVKVDLQDAYSNALTALPQAVNAGKAALFTITDIQHAHFLKGDPESNRLERIKATAVSALVGGDNGGRWSAEYINRQTDGAFGLVQELIVNPTHEKIDETLLVSLNALQKVKSALDAVPVATKLTTTEKSNLDTEKININTEITSISSKQQAIAVQKSINENSITTAEAKVNTAKNTLATAEHELDLKRAGYTIEQIKAQEAQVKQAKGNLASQKAILNQTYANVQHIHAQIAKTILRAPINGIVTRMEAKVGEIVMPSTSTYEIQRPLVSLISEGNFEIEANVPEVDIAKIKINNATKVTLDAYGNDVEFQATVTAIDPAETIVEGVSTYKVTLQFVEDDERIKSGMTANLDILTAKRDNVVAIPQRAVIIKNGGKIVRILAMEPAPENPNKKIEILKEVAVQTGLRGSDGRIEIQSGVQEGDKVVIFIKNEKK